MTPLTARRESIKKFIKVVAALEIIEKILWRDTRADEYRGAAEYFCIAMYDHFPARHKASIETFAHSRLPLTIYINPRRSSERAR
jgi:hypothetical protein